MAYDAVSICNLALTRIGINRPISALNDRSSEGRACNAVYENLRDTVLSDLPWKFASRREDLALVETGPSVDWCYSYRKPTDCLRMIEILNPLRAECTPGLPYEVGSDDAGELIYTDQVDAQLLFVKRITDPTRFSPTYCSALAWRIAADIAPGLTEKPAKADYAREQYAFEISTAAANDLNQQQPRPRPLPSSIRAR